LQILGVERDGQAEERRDAEPSRAPRLPMWPERSSLSPRIAGGVARGPEAEAGIGRIPEIGTDLTRELARNLDDIVALAGFGGLAAARLPALRLGHRARLSVRRR